MISLCDPWVCPLTTHYALIQKKVKTRARALSINGSSSKSSVEEYWDSVTKKLMINCQMEGTVKCHWRVTSLLGWSGWGRQLKDGCG